MTADRPTTLQLGGEAVRVMRIPLPEGLSLIVGHSLTPLADRLARLRLALGLGSVFILIIGVVIGWIASRPALRPIVEVAADTERVGTAVDAGAVQFNRLPSHAPRDELTTVASAFNRLIGALERALGRERATAERQRAFLANAAHELRTPVAILQSEAEASLASSDPAEHRRALVAIADEARELGALVGDLLTLARGEAPSDVTHQRLWLDDIAARVAARARSLPAAQGRVIRIGAFEAAPAFGDPVLFERALLALVHNALVHAAPSPVELSAGVTPPAPDAPARAWVQVRDWGPGIPADAHARVFERFERLAPDRPGTGLGLAIAQAAAESAGGTITLESVAGAGAVFTLSAPALRASEPGIPAGETAAIAAASAPSGGAG
jgi:signal transduction histidine kinase